MSMVPVSRREALKYAGIIVLAATSGQLSTAKAGTLATVRGYGLDPDPLKRPVTWTKTLDLSQGKSLAALCEIILPAQPPHPSAAAIGVQEFLEEWLSAPYPQMQADRALILQGLATLDETMMREHGVAFSTSDPKKQAHVLDEFCATQETQPAARRLIELVCAGYYTTREGHAAIGYVGNVAREQFPPPSPEIIKHLEDVLSGLPSAHP